MPKTVYSQEIRTPEPGSINTLCRYATTKTLKALFGNPRKDYSQQCQEVDSEKLKPFIVTETVGPFRVHGHKWLLEILRAVFAELAKTDPQLLKSVTSAGSLCARNVRGSTTSISRHSWGLAIDLKFDGELDAMGDGYTQVGLLRFYAVAKKHGLYWGAGFKREDSMHFEVSEDKLLEFAKRDGLKV